MPAGDCARYHRLAEGCKIGCMQVTDSHIVRGGKTVLRLEPALRLGACITDISWDGGDGKGCNFIGYLTDRGKTYGYG